MPTGSGLEDPEAERRFLLGSVSEEMVYSAHCPVLTVGPDVSPKPIPEHISLVLTKLMRNLHAASSMRSQHEQISFEISLALFDELLMSAFSVSRDGRSGFNPWRAAC
jgi:hypothetical protein